MFLLLLHSPVRAPRCDAPLIRFLISALYTLFACLYRMLPHLSCFPHFFLTYLLPLLIFSFENRPAPFPDRMSYKATKPGFSFLVFTLSSVHFFWLVNACSCYVRFIFFHVQPTDWLGETSPIWPILCRVGRKTTTHSSNQLIGTFTQTTHLSQPEIKLFRLTSNVPAVPL